MKGFYKNFVFQSQRLLLMAFVRVESAFDVVLSHVFQGQLEKDAGCQFEATN